MKKGQAFFFHWKIVSSLVFNFTFFHWEAQDLRLLNFAMTASKPSLDKGFIGIAALKTLTSTLSDQVEPGFI